MAERKKISSYVGVGLAAAVVIIAFAWWMTERNSPSVVAADEPHAVVNITDHGFVPAQLTVKKGTLVTWVNKTAAPHQIASDPYPTHSDLMGLYSGSPIDPEASYSYLFDKDGNWGYNDYLHPTVNGTVTVQN